jgi:hypothetical protein
MSSFAYSTAGAWRYIRPIMLITPASSTARPISYVSDGYLPHGFSSQMCLPARAAATATSLCK